MSLRDVTIARDGKPRLASVNDVTHRKRAEDFWEILKKSESWDETCLGRRTVGFRLLAETFLAVPHVFGAVGDEKSQHRKIVPLSPYVEKPLNSKVIKSFVPEQRSRYVFFEFRDSYILSLWTFYVRFTHGRIGLWYIVRD